ncbi:MAG TPA: oligosaccharide flippase family protein [Coriobacteriia bacterium]
MARTTSLARGTVLGVVAQVWQLLTAFLLYHYLSTSLGPAGFGEWRVTLSVLNYFEMLVTGGIVQVASKRLAEDPDAALRIERGAYLAQMLSAGLLFLALEVGAGLIAGALRDPRLEPLIRIAALDIPVVAAFLLAGNLRLGRQQFARQVAGMLVYATVKFLAIGGLVWLGFSVPGALIGNALSSIAGFAVLFVPWRGTGLRIRGTFAEARGMGIAAVPFLVQNLFSGVASDGDLWFVKALSGSTAAGLYGAAAALAETTSFLSAALSRVLFPSVARAGAEKSEALVARYTMQGVRMALLVTVLGVAVIAATGAEALTLVYTAAFAAAAVPFTLLMVASVGRNVRATCISVMMARGHRRQALAIVIVTTAAELALLAIVIPVFGQIGAAGVAAVAGLSAGAAAVWYLRELLGRRVLWTLVRASVAAAVVGVVLALVHPTGFWLFPAYAVACLAYALVLLLLREFDADDLASLRGATRRAS